MAKFKNSIGLGIAGNFALHLDQAGEAEDFKDIITEDEAAPKGMFPFYLPCVQDTSKDRPRHILSTYPLSDTTICLPKENVNVQAEPEVGLVCKLTYLNGKIQMIKPLHFGAYNDCSIREAGREKISDKKNWGKDSKGLSNTLIKIDKFEKGGIMDKYSICSFLRRDGEVHPYGENVELNGYSYFYEKLTEWMINQINTQEEFGPLEPLIEYIAACDYPDEAIISIGATRYTPYGESTFLKAGDEVIVIVYNDQEISSDEVFKCVQNNSYDAQKMSVLSQKVR